MLELYIKTYHLKAAKSLPNIYFEHFPQNSKFVPKLWPYLKTMYKFLKMKIQMTLVQYPISTLHFVILYPSSNIFILSEILPTLCSEVQNIVTPKI